MALKVMSVTDLRLEVLREASQSGETVTAVCRRFGISRETYYVYLRRFRAEGIEGLEPRSTVPLRQPQRMPADVEAVICALRKEHPKWGARRIRAELRREGIGPPAVSSIHRALSRNNLVAPGRARPRPATQRFERASPNDLWQIDATRLLLADESEVWVMDILDDHARFCLAARVHAGPTTVAALESFEWAIKRYGLPTQALSDIQADCALGSTVRPAGGGKLRGDRCPLCIAADRSERLTTPCLLGVSRAGATPGKERPVRYSVTGLGRIPVGECPARPPRWRRPSVPTRQGGISAETHAGNRCRLPGGPPGQPG
jgi:transposase-like protein